MIFSKFISCTMEDVPMYNSDFSSTAFMQKNDPKIVNTIKINGKYFDVSKIKEKALIALTSSAIASAILAILANIIF